MKHDRIYFKGNPWPEGHPVKEFVWSAKEKNGEVWFDMHLESANYYAERDIENNEDVDYPSDWAAPIVWSNYHSCILSSSYWHDVQQLRTKVVRMYYLRVGRCHRA